MTIQAVAVEADPGDPTQQAKALFISSSTGNDTITLTYPSGERRHLPSDGRKVGLGWRCESLWPRPFNWVRSAPTPAYHDQTRTSANDAGDGGLAIGLPR